MSDAMCGSGNCQAPAAIAALQADVRNLGREIGQLRAMNSDVSSRVGSVVTSSEALAAETRAVLRVTRDEVAKLFALNERLTEQSLSLSASAVTHKDLDKRLADQDVDIDALQRDYVTRAEHEETKKAIASINVRLAKVIAIASIASSILTSIAQPIVAGAIKGIFQ